MVSLSPAGGVRQAGSLFALFLDVFRLMFRRPFQFREFIQQAWFVASVTILPTMLVSIPFGAVIALQLGSLARQIGAQSFTGAASVLAIVREASPIVVALLIAGAGGSAICADLGSRKIRDEIDAMEVLGISPVQRLVVPRVLACTLVAVALNGLVSVVGTAGGYFFNVILQGGTPGAYLASFSAFAQLPDIYAGELKAFIFGIIAAVVASYKGLHAGGGPEGCRRRGEPVRGHHLPTAVLRQFRDYRRVLPGRPGEGWLAMAMEVMITVRRAAGTPLELLDRLGDQLSFYIRALLWTPRTLRRYKKEVMRLLSEVVFGSGSLAVIGGTVGVIAVMSFFTGTEVGLQGFAALDQLGIGSYAGFISAFFNTREIAPLVAGLALSATVGCGFTAQLGAMRISEEVDALEVMAVPSLPFLVTTRIIAGFIAIIPLYVIGLLSSYLATYVISWTTSTSRPERIRTTSTCSYRPAT